MATSSKLCHHLTSSFFLLNKTTTRTNKVINFTNKTSPILSLLLKPRRTFCSSATAEDVAVAHPCPERDAFVEKIRGKGYFAKTLQDSSDVASSSYSSLAMDLNRVRNACLSFSRERDDIIRMDTNSESRNMDEFSQGERLKKVRNTYIVWTKEESRELLRLLVEEVKNGNKMDNGNFKKYIIDQNVLPIMNAKFGRNLKYNHIQNKIMSWKRKINPVEILLKNNSGFGWDPISHRITCSSEVWEIYKQAHPNTPMFKDKLFENLDDLRMVVGSHFSTGRAAGGLGVEGVESATLHNALGEGRLDDDVSLDDMGVENLTLSPIGTPPLSPNSTTDVDTRMTSSVPPTSNTTRNMRRGASRKTVGAWSNSTLQEITTEITVISKALVELVLEVKLLRSRNLPWVEGVCTIPEFTDEQRLTVLNENVSQDLKDAFVRMTDGQRRRFMIWRLSGTFPSAIEEDENL